MDNDQRGLFADDELAAALGRETLPVYILPTYTAMVELRSAVIHLCGGNEFWE